MANIDKGKLEGSGGESGSVLDIIIEVFVALLSHPIRISAHYI
jgi:hypothetical protein